MTHRSTRRWFSLALPVLLFAAAGLAWAAAGNLDPSFGSGGVVVTPATGYAPGSAVQGDGKLIVCGAQNVSGVDPTGYSRSSWWIRRFNADGTVDAGFGTGGATALFGEGADGARRVAIDGSGRAVVLGKTSVFVVSNRSVSASYYLTIVRLNANGSLDTSFGSSGIVRVAPPGTKGTAYSAPDGGLILEPDGGIVVGGRTFTVIDKKGTTAVYPFLARYAADGALDASFGGSGFSIDTRAAVANTVPAALARQSTGHRVLAGRRSGANWVITRYLPSGGVDTAFAPILGSGDYVGGLAVDRFDRIVATGRNTYSNGQFDILVARYTASGAADAFFGAGGRTLVHSTYNQNCWADPVFQSGDDKIVVGANFVSSTGYGVTATLRLLDNGSLDDTYGTAGIGSALDLGRGQTSASAVGFAPDGRILHTGLALGANGWNWMLARLDAN